jgi:hypothetical protein
MGPKLLGGAASLLAAAFILVLPSIFVGEPASEVEPIRFGPAPVARLGEAVRVTVPPAKPPPPDLPRSAAPTPVEAQVVRSNTGTSGGGTASGTGDDAAATVESDEADEDDDGGDDEGEDD